MMNKPLSINTKIALTTLIVLLISSLVTAVSVNAIARSHIVENTKNIVEQGENQKEIQEDLNDVKVRIATIETHYEHIVASLENIETKFGGK